MKQHQKWLHESLSNEAAEKFEAETQDVATFDQALLKVTETSWRGALEWFKSEIDRCHAGNDVIDLIFEEELKE